MITIFETYKKYHLKLYEWWDDEEDGDDGVTVKKIVSTSNYYVQEEWFHNEGPYYIIYDEEDDKIGGITTFEDTYLKEDEIFFEENIRRINISYLNELKEVLEKFREYIELTNAAKKYNL